MTKANLILCCIVSILVLIKLALIATRPAIDTSIALQWLNISVFIAIGVCLSLMHILPNASRWLILLIVLLGCAEVFWKYLVNSKSLIMLMASILGYFMFGIVLWSMVENKLRLRKTN